MPRAKKTWREKLAAAKAKPDLPKVFFCEKCKQRLHVPSPDQVERLMGLIPAGRVATIAQLADRLKTDNDADLACPMTTGIFAWIIAHAAEEDRAVGAGGGHDAGVPWWRLLKAGGELNAKYPGGGQTQKRRLAAEGLKVVAKGKKLIVAEYEKSQHEFT
jgi:alkylated DNA nucleotide flippase Atl1